MSAHLREYVAPLGSGRDDSYAIQAAMLRMAGVGEVRLYASTYTIARTVNAPSRTTFVGRRGARILSTIPPSGSAGSPDNPVFKAVPPNYTRTTTLAADTVPGTRTITLTDASAFSAEDEIAIAVTNYVAWYRVVSRSYNVLTVDRVVLHFFPSGAQVVDRFAPKHIRFLYEGTTVDGTGDAVNEFSTGAYCEVSGLHVTAETGCFAHVLVNFDVASIGCSLSDSVLDAGSTSPTSGATSGFHFECNEHGRAKHVIVSRPRLQGWLVTAGYANKIVQVHVEESQNMGGVVSTAHAEIGGGKTLSLTGCTFEKNVGPGLDIQGGAARVKAVNCEARHNGGYGFVVNSSGTTGSRNCQFTNCDSSHNQGGWYVSRHSTGAMLSNCVADDCLLYGFSVDGDAQLSNVSSRDCLVGGLAVGFGGRADVSQAVMASAVDGPWTAFTNQSMETRPLDVRGARISMAGAGTKIAFSGQADAVVYAESVLTSGGTYGWTAGSNGRLFLRGPNVNMSSCTTPYDGGTLSFGDVTLSGATPVDLSFDAATADDRPRARRVAVAGTPGPFTVAAVDGAIRVIGTDGDESTVALDLI